MKKLLALISLITCILGLTACGGEQSHTEYETTKINYAQQLAVDQVIPMLQSLAENGGAAVFDGFTAEEVEYQIGNNNSINVEGYAVINGASSFESALKEIGSIVSIGTAEAVIDDDQIIVNVQIDGEKKDAKAEVIFSNDMFMVLKSASLNPVSSIGEMMEKAALNTLIGMGTVFVVLILISAVISAFRFIPAIQAKFTKKTAVEEKKEAPIVQAPVVEEAEEETDDLELVAVIAAAIAASEGAATTDGFVVRSIRKVNRNRR